VPLLHVCVWGARRAPLQRPPVLGTLWNFLCDASLQSTAARDNSMLPASHAA